MSSSNPDKLSNTRGLDSLESIDEANAAFWNELCGTSLANQLGITDGSKESLELFDRWYLALYPYLDRYIPFDRVAGKKLLEVGLGYGTVSQKLAEAGSAYHGLDIAEGPVRMVQSRLQMSGTSGDVRVGSVLKCPFDSETFDYVIAIGCYHHTGNLARAIDETWRVLRPGGEATVMVYNAYSYRRWIKWPLSTARYLLRDRTGRSEPPGFSENERRAYDARSDGTAAPETDFVSRAHLARLCARFTTVEMHSENAGGEFPLHFIPRRFLLATLGKVAGLDIYVRLTK